MQMRKINTKNLLKAITGTFSVFDDCSSFLVELSSNSVVTILENVFIIIVSYYNCNYNFMVGYRKTKRFSTR